ncbi:MAG: DNA polymerase IV [Verrucomicrobiales bacterium]|nr:DNA polymerase IV [Verrucomicrobiales bacterium]
MFRVILHLDMDAFYASVEQRDRPELKGRPVIVGAPPSQRGVVCAASYEARRFGVRSAMPSVTAGRLCPTGVFLRPRMEAYRNESRIIMALVRGFAGDLIQQVSIDEAYLDVSAQCQGADADASLDLAVPLAREIQSTVVAERGLTTSLGVAPNRLLAKLASDFQKPNGLTVIHERDKVAFLRPLPIRCLHGIGRVTEANLNAAGIETVGDLQDFPGDLSTLVGSWGPELRRFAFGDDRRPLDLGDEIKSISSENTFGTDTDDRRILRECLKEQAGEIAAKLAERHVSATTVQVKVRYSDFSTLTRQVSVEESVGDAADLYRLACHLLARHRLVHRPLRLLGMGVSGLVETRERQLHLALGLSDPGKRRAA